MLKPLPDYGINDPYQNSSNDPLPIPPRDDRFPGLRYVEAREGAKKKDPDSKPRIVSDDTEFNIFDVPDTTFIRESEVKLFDVQPFSDYTRGVVLLDLEWVGPDGGSATGTKDDIIVAIGVRYRGKSYLACNKDKTEKELLQWFFARIESFPQVHTIAGYAIYGFYKNSEEVMVDLAMIYHRCLLHGLECPWKPSESKYNTYRWQNAIVFGKPLEVPAWDCDLYELIDIYPQIVLYDSLVRKLENYRLKDSVIGFGLRKDRRIEIGDKIHEYWSKGDVDTIKTYLDYDLEDTELLWNFLTPQNYFMKAYMSWTLQRITTTGTGSWWNSFMIDRTKMKPKKTQTCSYQGALTFYMSGIHRSLMKCDFSGLYPSIMLTWLVCSHKDSDYIALKTLFFLLKYRKSIKKTPEWIRFDGGDRSPECLDADGRQNTAKRSANSLYGLWNTKGLNFNDPYAGAAVCAYGRQLSRYMINWLYENKNLDTRGCDTDAAMACLINPQEYDIHGFEKGINNYTEEEILDNLTKMDVFFKQTVSELNSTMPGYTAVDYEDLIPFMWVPPNIKDKDAGKTLADKLNSVECYENVTPDQLDPGLSKNYIYAVAKRDKDGKLTGKFTLKSKGKFKKRDKNWIQKDFVIDLITKLFYDGEHAAKEFALDVRAQIASGTLPLEKLQKTVLVASNWKQFVEWGFPVGSRPCIHYTWRGETTGKKRIKKVFVATDNISEFYAPEYYLDQFDTVLAETPVKL
jgi:DNA polymerase elongation subunit (family B)